MSHVVRVDEEVAAWLRENAEPGESANAVIRRRLGLPPNQARRSDAWARRRVRVVNPETGGLVGEGEVDPDKPPVGENEVWVWLELESGGRIVAGYPRAWIEGGA